MPRKPIKPPPAPAGCVWQDRAAEMCGQTPRTMRLWRSKGVGPKSFLVGTKVAYRTADITAWLEAQYEAGTGHGDSAEYTRPAEPKAPAA